jgi:hypothetical protein
VGSEDRSKTTCHCGREYRFANSSGTVLLGQDYLKEAVCCDLKEAISSSGAIKRPRDQQRSQHDI